MTDAQGQVKGVTIMCVVVEPSGSQTTTSLVALQSPLAVAAPAPTATPTPSSAATASRSASNQLSSAFVTSHVVHTRLLRMNPNRCPLGVCAMDTNSASLWALPSTPSTSSSSSSASASTQPQNLLWILTEQGTLGLIALTYDQHSAKLERAFFPSLFPAGVLPTEQEAGSGAAANSAGGGGSGGSVKPLDPTARDPTIW
jgi:hypothetical protein